MKRDGGSIYHFEKQGLKVAVKSNDFSKNDMIGMESERKKYTSRYSDDESLGLPYLGFSEPILSRGKY